MDELTVRPYAPGDESAILTSFNAVFREVCGPSYVDRTLDHWRWQYVDNPAGIRAHVAMTKDGICAAHYAALPVRAVTPRGPTVFSQIVDSFVLQRFRQGLKRPGLFVGTAVPALEHWLSLGDALFHGMPVEDARRMSVRFLGYTTWRSIDYLVRDAREDSGAIPSDIAIATVAKPSPDVDVLADRFAREKTCTTLRDAAYIGWRYATHPARCYEIVEARRRGALVGLMVLRPAHELLPGSCTIAELITEPGETAGLDGMLACATQRARALGRKQLMAVFAPHAREMGSLHDRGFQSEPAALSFFRSIGCRLRPGALDFATVGQHWWYSLGDFDLV